MGGVSFSPLFSFFFLRYSCYLKKIKYHLDFPLEADE